MESSGEGEDFQDIWTETLRERGCDQSGPRGCTELTRLREAAECHGVCGRMGKQDAGRWGGRVTWKMQVTGADDSD